MPKHYGNPSGEAHYGKAKSFPAPMTATGKPQKLKGGVPMNNPTAKKVGGIRSVRPGAPSTSGWPAGRY